MTSVDTFLVSDSHRRPWIVCCASLVSLLLIHERAPEAAAAKLQAGTVQAWDRYLEWADAKVNRELSDSTRLLIEDFLPPHERAEIKRKLDAGEVVIRKMQGVVPSGVRFAVPDGEIHHWWGCILVPNSTLPRLMPFLQDYDHHAGKFADVAQSRLLSRDGDYYRFFFRLRRTKAIVTAYYNSEHECVYSSHGPKGISSRSTATKIAELENPATPSERERPAGDDRGFLWRLVSWWRFQETDKGVVVECESASLSRDIPTFAKLIPGIAAYIRSTPKESLESVLTGIRTHAPTR